MSASLGERSEQSLRSEWRLSSLRATTTAADPKRAQDRVPLSWTNERADTLFVCE
jgi:hypothetical protein